jgi:hypothetical protein
MSESVQNAIPILSLIVALLAVFVSPVLSWITSKRQMEVTIRTIKLQVISPMRQVWINHLRELIAEVASSCLHYWQTGTFEDLNNEEYKRITDIEHKIRLMINPNEGNHINLLESIRKMVATTGAANQKEDKVFFAAYNAVIELGQAVLKEEWKVVKSY